MTERPGDEAGTARVALTNALENVKQAGRGLLKSREAALAELEQRRHGGQRELVAQYERALAQVTREFLREARGEFAMTQVAGRDGSALSWWAR